MTESRADVPYGVLDLFALKTLDAMGPLHGFGLARRIEQTSGQRLQINQGSIYPALLRLEQNGWIRYEWGTSEKNRRAKYYTLTDTGAYFGEVEHAFRGCGTRIPAKWNARRSAATLSGRSLPFGSRWAPEILPVPP